MFHFDSVKTENGEWFLTSWNWYWIRMHIGPSCCFRWAKIALGKNILRQTKITRISHSSFDSQNGGQVGYIPECTPDGRYQRVQCYRSVGYCWCVHEDTGKNIPGTSVKGARPNCSVSDNRPIKGCREQNEGDFFKELKDFLKDQISGKVKG